jgi:hypothetical protein
MKSIAENTDFVALLNGDHATVQASIELADEHAARTNAQLLAELAELRKRLVGAEYAAHQHQQTAACVRDALNGCQMRIGRLQLNVAALVIVAKAANAFIVSKVNWSSSHAFDAAAAKLSNQIDCAIHAAEGQ